MNNGDFCENFKISVPCLTASSSIEMTLLGHKKKTTATFIHIIISDNITDIFLHSMKFTFNEFMTGEYDMMGFVVPNK